MSNSNIKLVENALAEKLFSKPGQSLNLNVYLGFLGKTVENDRWRLYTNIDMSEYFEFNEEDVVHKESIQADGFSFVGSIVWFKKNAELSFYKSVLGSQVSFLKGDISDTIKSSMTSLEDISFKSAGTRACLTLGCCKEKSTSNWSCC